MSFSIFTVTVKREAPLNFFFQVSVSGANFKRYKSFLSIFFFFFFFLIFFRGVCWLFDWSTNIRLGNGFSEFF